ncbi:MAG: cadherin-like domain-containing protein [Dehalococcoidia bacterium]|nr:cadherin-like domain-containing protein [Dehalococcoidia bacterium]
MRLRISSRVLPAAVAAGVLVFGLAGVASAQTSNQAPVAQNDTATTNEDTPVTIAVLANDTDADGDTLSVASVTNGTKGTVAVSGTSVVYTPNANLNGSDTFTYVVSDGTLTATGTVTVTITPVNDPPVAISDTVTVTKDIAKVITVLSNDTDVDGDALTVASVSLPAHGTAVITDGTKVTYTPATGYLGTDSFTYVVSDGSLVSATTVSITVQAATAPPSGTPAKVAAACEAYASMDQGVRTLCSLYLGNQLPAWAQESIGAAILKRVSHFNQAEVICAATGNDATVTALCGIYTNSSTPAWLKKDIGKLIEQYVKATANVSTSDDDDDDDDDDHKDKNKSKTKQSSSLSIATGSQGITLSLLGGDDDDDDDRKGRHGRR